MKRFFILIFFLLASCGPAAELESRVEIAPIEATQPFVQPAEQPALEPTIEPTFTPQAVEKVHLAYEYDFGDSGMGIDVWVEVETHAVPDLILENNQFVYADGHDQIAYMWIPQGLDGCTPNAKKNLDPANFGKFYKVTLPEDDDWAPEDVILLAHAMDSFLGLQNAGMCATIIQGG